jgi:hypothetical protein
MIADERHDNSQLRSTIDYIGYNSRFSDRIEGDEEESLTNERSGRTIEDGDSGAFPGAIGRGQQSNVENEWTRNDSQTNCLHWGLVNVSRLAMRVHFHIQASRAHTGATASMAKKAALHILEAEAEKLGSDFHMWTISEIELDDVCWQRHREMADLYRRATQLRFQNPASHLLIFHLD